jgi:hypothetical protein
MSANDQWGTDYDQECYNYDEEYYNPDGDNTNYSYGSYDNGYYDDTQPEEYSVVESEYIQGIVEVDATPTQHGGLMMDGTYVDDGWLSQQLQETKVINCSHAQSTFTIELLHY